MSMKNPVHPGSIVLHDCIEPLNLTITRAAHILGVTRQTLNNLVHEKAGISAEMAVKLSMALGASPQFWLNLQQNWELSRVTRRPLKRIKPIAA